MNTSLDINSLNRFLLKLCDLLGLTESERSEFISTVNQGLLFNFLADGKDIVSPATFKTLKNASEKPEPDPREVSAAVNTFIKEMRETEEGKKVIQKRLAELAHEMYDSVKDRLTPAQKQELTKSLSNPIM